ncbi:MAG: DciA family protein [Pararobbsia sp.]
MRSARAVGDLLGETEALAALRAGMRQVAALEQDLVGLLPDYLAPHVSVGTIKGEMLTIFAGHSALAARLRHLERGLVHDLQQRGWPVAGFKVKVRPVVKPAPEPKQAKVSAAGIECLRTLAAGLDASPLREALERMLARHGKPKS